MGSNTISADDNNFCSPKCHEHAKWTRDCVLYNNEANEPNINEFLVPSEPTKTEPVELRKNEDSEPNELSKNEASEPNELSKNEASESSAVSETEASETSENDAPEPREDEQDLCKTVMTYTENSALTYSTTNDPRLDFFFMILEDTRRKTNIKYLTKSWDSNEEDTLKAVANLRDVRKGKSIKLQWFYSAYWLYTYHPRVLYNNLEHFVRIGCWKDLLSLLTIILFDGTVHEYLIHEAKYKPNEYRRRSQYVNHQYDSHILNHYNVTVDREEYEHYRIKYAKDKYNNDRKYRLFHNKIAKLFSDGLLRDLEKMKRNKKISTCAKWAPTCEYHFDRYTLIATSISNYLNIFSPDKDKCDITQTYLLRREYQKLLVTLRKYSKVVECIIPHYDQIDYNTVPAKALLRYNKSFKKHDGERYEAFLNDKKSRVSSGGLKPYELIMRMSYGGDNLLFSRQFDGIVSDLKKNRSLFKQAVSVCDVSGSMHGIPMIAAISLTLVVMELTDAPWNRYCITFSESPEIFELDPSLSIEAKLDNLRGMNWGGNTDLNKVFKLIVQTGIENGISNDDMPKVLFIFTDMEFDCACGEHTNVQEAKILFESKGYTFPLIVFWNLRTSQSIPITSNDKGIMLAGFSSNLLKYLMCVDLNDTNPIHLFNEIIGDKRYFMFKC